VLAAAGALSVGTSARASEPVIPAANGSGMDLHLFRPPLDSKGLASVNGADVLGAWDWAIGLFVDYGHGFMPLNDGHEADRLIDHSFQGTLQFNLGIADLLSVGISGPVTLNAGGATADIGPTGATYAHNSFNQESLGFLALHSKLRILNPRSDVIGLAVAVQLGLAAGSGGPRSLAAEPGFFYWPQVILEKKFFEEDNELRLALNVGYRGHTGSNPQFGLGADGLPQLVHGELEYGDLVTAGLGISYRPVYELDLFAETYMSALVTGSSDAEERVSAEAIGGLKIHVEKRSFLFLAGGGGYTPGFQAAGVRAVLGFVFEPSVTDTDGDGIPDKDDACPNVKGPSNDDPKLNGCPPEPSPDRDGDGIPDAEDQCPDQYGTRAYHGCRPPPDRDGDGIPDDKDACPDEKGVRSDDPDKNGCPPARAPEDQPDRDEDGVPDT